MKICEFTVPELNKFRQLCNFTDDEERLLSLRAQDVPMEKCAEIMNISTSTAKRIHKKIWTKIERLKNL